MPETAALLLPPPANESHSRQAQSSLGGASSSSFTSMDANIMKLLEQDDDETLHSGADLEAFQAALNRDISGEDSTSLLPPPHSGSKFGKHDTYAVIKDTSVQIQKQILPKVERKENGTVPSQKNSRIISQEADYHNEETRNSPIHKQVKQNTSHAPHDSGMQASDIDTRNGAKYLNRQSMRKQHEELPRKLTNQTRSTKSVPFGLLLPIILPQLDKDKGTQLTTIYEKLKKKDISREHFTKIMRSIVAEKLLLLAVDKVILQPSTQQKQIPVQTYNSTNLPSSDTATTCKESYPANLLPQKRSRAEIHSGTAPFQKLHPWKTPSLAGADTTTPYKPYDSLKKSVDTRDSSQTAMSKKPKVSGEFDDQSIEKLVDVTAISGVNLLEEEKSLFSDLREDGQIPEEWRKAVNEEEGKLILERLPLQKRVAIIMAKNGMKKMNKDVERCLSMSVEERIHGLLLNLIRSSKQRVDAEKPKHQTVITSDIHQNLMILNRKANAIWTKKQEDAEKLRKLSESECSTGVSMEEKERDEVVRGKAVKGVNNNKEGDDKMRTTAANVAARVAVGGDDHWSKWQLMAEQARQRREAGLSEMIISAHKQSVSTTSGRFTKDASVSARGIDQGQDSADRIMSVKDVIGVLEREPQMSKSILLYNLYNRT